MLNSKGSVCLRVVFIVVAYGFAQCQTTGVNIAVLRIVTARPDEAIVCGFPSEVTFNITLQNQGNVKVSKVLDKNSNFDVTIQLTDGATLGQAKLNSTVSIQTYVSASNQLGVAALESLIVQVRTQVHISHENCSSFPYICTTVRPGRGASYVESVLADNSFCASVKSVVEIIRPGVDVQALALEYSDNQPIIRNTVRNYSVQVSAAIADGQYGILHNVRGNNNFKAWFFMRDTDPPVECKETQAGLEYKGRRSFVESSICDQWSIYNYSSESFPERSVDEVENYCRNPDQSDTGPWCFINTVKSECRVPFCPNSRICRHYTTGGEYIGTQNQTLGSHSCQRWDSQTPHTHNYGFLSNDENYCRNPNSHIAGPWCYTENSNVMSELCGIPLCYPDGQFYVDHMPIEEAFVEIEEGQMTMDLAGFITINLTLPVYLDFTVCGKHSTLCVVLSNDVNSTYVDSNSDNNMVCKNMRKYIKCYPEIDIQPTSVIFDKPLVRGYNTTITVHIEMQNMDSNTPVLDLEDQQNFKVKIFFTNYDVKSIGSSTSENIKIERQVNVSHQEGLQPGASITLTGEVCLSDPVNIKVEIKKIQSSTMEQKMIYYQTNPVVLDFKFCRQNLKSLIANERIGLEVLSTELPITTVLVERELCAAISHICVLVLPGPAASYSIFPGSTHIQCFTADNSHKNCIGSKIFGVTFYGVELFGRSGHPTTLQVHWEAGTDVQFQIDFGDKTAPFDWTWEMQRNESGLQETTVLLKHTYKEMGTYNAEMRIWNGVTTEVYNTTVYIQPNLADYVEFETVSIPKEAPAEVQFQITTSGTLVWMTCDIDWGDNSSAHSFVNFNVTQILRFSHIYGDRFTNTRTTFTCYNDASSVVYVSDDIILRERITGLLILSQEEAYTTSENAYFDLWMNTGSHVNLVVDFGDGSLNNYTNNNVLSSSFVWVISHVYSTPNNFSVHVKAFNERFQYETALQSPVRIQNPVSNITIQGNNVIKYPNGEAFLEVQQITADVLPTDVFCRWSVNGNTSKEFYSGSLTSSSNFTHTFHHSDIGQINVVKATCQNLVSTQTTSLLVHVIEEIDEIIVAAPVIFALPNQTLGLSVLALHGSHVGITFNFGNNVTKSISHPHLFADSQEVTCEYSFSTVGNYSVNVTFYNLVSTVSTEVIVSVRNTLTDLTLSANESVMAPPATVTHILSKGIDQPDLHHIHCDWMFAWNDTEFTYIPVLDDTHSFHFIANYTKSPDGPSAVTVNCTNQVSWLTLQTSVVIIHDAVINGSLQSMPPVWYTNVSTVILKIIRLGPRFCILWNMGDGTRYLYGSEWCSQFAQQQNLELNGLSVETVEIIQHHTYSMWGNYTVQVSAFNHVSLDNISTVTIVKDWYCNKPEVFFPSNLSNRTTQFKRGSEFDIKPDVLLIDCMKSRNKTISTFTVFKLMENEEEEAVLSIQNVTSFHHLPRMLYAGLYKLNFYIAMLGLDEFNDTAEFYLEITESPLKVEIEGEGMINVNFSKKIDMNALDVSFDPDLEPILAQGITFEWFCRQVGEDFRYDEDGHILPVGEPYLKGLDIDTFQGCFGGGPGKLPETSGRFILDTGMMVHNKTFVVTVEAHKDTRTGTANKVITVHTPAAPVITIECRENCDYKMRISGSLILDVNCTENCETKYGGIHYVWSLEWFDNETGNGTEYTKLGAILRNGINERTLYTEPSTIVPGKWHVASVEVWTPFSHRALVRRTFLTNVPPFGGSCLIHPDSGYAMLTKFEVRCDNWTEWLVGHSTSLSYEYRVQSLGSDRSYLLYHGSNPSADQMFLPMGNYRQEFLNEVVIYIVDSVGDYFKVLNNVTVKPEAIPKTDIVYKILSQLENDTSELRRLIQEEKYQPASDRVYSMLSLLNLPRSFATTNGSENDTYLLALKKTTRTALTELVATFPVKSMEGLDQINEIIRGALDEASEVNLDTQGTGVNKIGDMANFFVTERKNATPEKKKRLATDLTISTMKVRIASNYYLEDSMRSSHTNSSDDFETSTQVYKTTSESPGNITEQDTTKAKVSEVMKKSVAVVNSLTGALLEDKLEGDPDDVISFDELTLMLGKEKAGRLSQAEYTSNHGGVVMPDVSGEDWAGGCVERKLAFSSINTYIWDDSAEDVKSGVVEFEITSCSNQESDTSTKISREKLPLQSAFEVALPVKDVEEPKYVSQNISSEADMLFHPLELSQSTKSAVTVAVYPLENETLDVYIQFNEFPTEDTFYKMMRVPKNQSLATEDAYELMHTDFIPLKDITDSKADYIYIGVKKAGCVEGTVCHQMDALTLTYLYKLAESKCQIWDSVLEMWTSKGCEVQAGSTAKKVKFKSNLFGSMGAGLFVGPNLIDFSSVFDNLSQKFADNAAVVCTVAVFMVLYIPLVILCRRMDIKDRKKWMVMPLVDNVKEDTYAYEIHVYTGMKRNSGTTSKVDFILAGTEGDTGTRLLEDNQRKNFQTGDVNSFLLTTEVRLGIPCTVKIWHDNTGDSSNKDWYLAKIVLVDLQTKKWYLFLCDQWLSMDKEDGRIDRVLHISSDKDLLDNNFLLQNNIKRKLFDDHLWFSIGYRKTRSTFSRVQRLSCCWAMLFLTMVSNAMWYGTGDETNSTAFQIGPISVTAKQLYTSIMSSLIVVPPALVISILFAKSGGRRKRSSESDTKENINAAGKMSKPPAKTQKRLPVWCILIAYVLVVCSVVCGGFFTVLYAFQWGKEKSEEWLGTFMLSFVQSVLLIQPAKVIVVAILLSFLLKKDADIVDYEDCIGQMESRKDSMKPANPDILKQSKDLSEEELNKIKKRQELNKKTSHLFKEVVWKFVFLFLLLWVVTGNQSENVFIQNQDLKSMLTNNLNNVRDVEQTWQWFHNQLLPSLYLTHDYNQKAVTPDDVKFIQNGYAMRLGPPRLRQLRVKPDTCKIVKLKGNYINRCANTYSVTHEDQNDYTPGWLQTSNHSKTIDLSRSQQAFVYQTESDMKGVPYWGLFKTYSGGGYVANLGNTIMEAQEQLNELEENLWIDRFTRVVFVEFNVWNANSNLFNLVILTFEFPTVGGVFNWLTVNSVNLYRYAGSAGFFNLLIEIIATIFIIVETILEGIKIRKHWRTYFKQQWNIVLWLCLFLYYCSMGVYAWRSVLTASTVEEMMNNRGKSINFQKLAQAHEITICLLGVMGFLLELHLLHVLRYAKSVSIMTATLKRCATDLMNVATGFIILFTAFTAISFLMFGPKMFEYRSVVATANFLTTAFLGLFNFHSTLEETGVFGAFILLFYLVLMVMFWMNIFISVLNEYLDLVRQDKESISTDHEVLEHLFNMLLGTISGSKNDGPCTDAKKNMSTPKSVDGSQNETSSAAEDDEINKYFTEGIEKWIEESECQDLTQPAFPHANSPRYKSKQRLYQTFPRFQDRISGDETLHAELDTHVKNKPQHTTTEIFEDMSNISFELKNTLSKRPIFDNFDPDEFTWDIITVEPYESQDVSKLDSGISSVKTSTYCSIEDLTTHS